MKNIAYIAVAVLLLACNPESNKSQQEVIATAIKLSANDLTIEKGGNHVLTVAFNPSNTTRKDITWVSSDTEIATVTDGIVVGVAPGSTEIIAKCGNVTDKCKVTVVISTKGITLDKTTLDLNVGSCYTLTATVTPDNATDKTLTWTSSNTSIATVGDGVVVGVAPGSTEIIVKCGNATDKCMVTVLVPATGINLSTKTLVLNVENCYTLTATVTPDNTTDKTLWASSNTSVATVADGVVVGVAPGTTVIIAECGNVTDKCKVTVIPAGAVDLGIVMPNEKTSGTYKLYWASSNLSNSGLCARPEDYGDYYAWGEIEPKTEYTLSSYKWHKGSYDYMVTKYCQNDCKSYWAGSGNPDNHVVLLPNDDAAHAKLGGKWRMPTNAEWEKLRTQCTWTWITQNGVNGLLVTASNGNSIFLPAAGFMSQHYFGGLDEECFYWSSSLWKLPDMAFCLNFGPGDGYYTDCFNRSFGLSVRPVSE